MQAASTQRFNSVTLKAAEGHGQLSQHSPSLHFVFHHLFQAGEYLHPPVDRPCRQPGSRAWDSQVTSVCANSSNKIHFQKVKSPQIFAWGPQVKPHVEDTHTYTHKDVDTLGRLAVSGTPELSQPANILAVSCLTCRGYWQATELWKQLYLRVGTRTDAGKKMCWLYTKAESYSHHSDRIGGFALKKPQIADFTSWLDFLLKNYLYSRQ